jgi:hypothetical protein
MKESLIAILKETSRQAVISLRNFIPRWCLRSWKHAPRVRCRYSDAFDEEGILRPRRGDETRHLRWQKSDRVLFVIYGHFPGPDILYFDEDRRTYPACKPRKRKRRLGPSGDEEFPLQSPHASVRVARPPSDHDRLPAVPPGFGFGFVGDRRARFVRPEHAPRDAHDECVVAPPHAVLLECLRANRDGAQQLHVRRSGEQVERLHVRGAEREKHRYGRIARVR